MSEHSPNSVGASWVTNVKQEHFRAIIRTHLRIVGGIFRKHAWAERKYYFFDMNAGTGKDPLTGSPGSALVALDEIERSGIRGDAILMEKNAKTYRELIASIGEHEWPPRMQILPFSADHHEILPRWYSGNSNRFGLIYNDNNGIPSFGLLAEASLSFPRVDFLINCPASAIKRDRNCSLTHGTKTLDEYRSAIRKEFWIVREPYYKWQWTFLIGTNWDSFPAFKKLGFYRLDSFEGREIYKVLNHTREELQCLSQS